MTTWLFLLLLAADRPEDRPPDVAITATVRAKELRFETVPNVTVTFDGRSASNVWRSDRENLPKPVEPRTIYRDIGIRLTITSTLEDIERIVDEALAAQERNEP